MNYYLISPKADGQTIESFLEKMFAEHIVMMGWRTDNKIGEKFNHLKKGDFVLVAQRRNWKFIYYFAGIIDDDEAYIDEDCQCRKLSHFVDLRNDKTDFLEGVSFSGMQSMRAMVAIRDNNINIIHRLNNIIQNHMEEEMLDQLTVLLKNNYNLILTGAPGTGKTFLAKEIAKKMGAEGEACKLVQFHPSYDYTDFVEGLRPIKEKDNLGFKRKDGAFKSFCKKAIQGSNCFETGYRKFKDKILDAPNQEYFCETFGHSDNKFKVVIENDEIFFFRRDSEESKKRAYKDRLEKLYQYYVVQKHVTDVRKAERTEMQELIGSGLEYTHYRGILQEIINLSDAESHQNFVFIIDEINRGEISKIFGELFYSIDSGYRGKNVLVETQYQNLIPKEGDPDFDESNADVFRNGFYVPENVYIIGTMNDIDRSVESMDFAMRRRFAWKEITAESRQSMLNDENAWRGKKPDQSIIDEIINRMNNLNACIIDEYGDEELSIKEKIGLTKAYQIGAAYFLKYNMYNNFDDLWHNHIEGLLYEYLRGTANIEAKIKRLYSAYKDKTVH